jgi:hypothetical protein
MVMVEVAGEDAPQVLLVEHDHVIETFSADAAQTRESQAQKKRFRARM